jgi:hypothetical protein
LLSPFIDGLFVLILKLTYLPIFSSFQGVCGACWAFVAAASTEAAVRLSLLQSTINIPQNNQLATQIPSLSAQELIDCDADFNRGCSGGNPIMAFGYIAQNGIGAEFSYPYSEKVNEECQSARNQSRYYITRIRRIVSRSEAAIRVALEEGPVSIGLCGTDLPFLFYASGIFDYKDCCGIQNHAMLIVGYGRDESLGLDYWIAQNSWGVHWGEKGFMRILRNSDSSGGGGLGGAGFIPGLNNNNPMDSINNGDGVCGLATNPSQALDGYFIRKDGVMVVGNGRLLYLVPFYRFYLWLLDNWKVTCNHNYFSSSDSFPSPLFPFQPVTVGVALFLMLISFLFLAYGLYLDRLVQQSLEGRGLGGGFHYHNHNHNHDYGSCQIGVHHQLSQYQSIPHHDHHFNDLETPPRKTRTSDNNNSSPVSSSYQQGRREGQQY